MIKKLVKINMISEIKLFNQAALKVECDVDIKKDRYVIDAKSIMGLFDLDLSKPVELIIHTEKMTPDVTAFLDTISSLIEEGEIK